MFTDALPILDQLTLRFPLLKQCEKEIIDAYMILEECFKSNKKLLVAGNGGSAADSEHIAGELMKSFKLPRPISADLSEKIKKIDSTKGELLAKELQYALTTIPLVSHVALTTAYSNDVDPSLVFAQQLLGFGCSGDVFLGISTSGNSRNVVYAAITAKALGMKVIGLTGADGGDLSSYADVCVKVPYEETFMVQELHLPVYHCWCLMLEKRFFNTCAPQ